MDAEKVKAYEPLIKKCIKIYLRDYEYKDDAMQEGYFVVAKCLKNYDESLNIPFGAYVKRAVIYAIRDFAYKVNRKDISLDEENDEGGTLVELLQSNDNVESDCVKDEDILRMRKAIELLSEKQKNVIFEYYFQNKSLIEISKNRRCHYMSVVNLKNRAIERLREEMVAIK